MTHSTVLCTNITACSGPNWKPKKLTAAKTLAFFQLGDLSWCIRGNELQQKKLLEWFAACNHCWRLCHLVCIECSCTCSYSYSHSISIYLSLFLSLLSFPFSRNLIITHLNMTNEYTFSKFFSRFTYHFPINIAWRSKYENSHKLQLDGTMLDGIAWELAQNWRPVGRSVGAIVWNCFHFDTKAIP